MKLFSICVLVTLFVTHGQSQESRASQSISKQLKNGAVSIQVANNRIILKILRLDGVNTKNILLTQNSKFSSDATWKIEDKCDNQDNAVCITTGNVKHTKIIADSSSPIISVSRTIDDANGKLTDCYQLDDTTEWFGGPQLRHQHWPIQNMYYEEEPYIPTHPQNMAIAERYWLSSKGIYIYVDEKDPLFLDQNNYKAKHLCLISKNKSPYQKRDKLTLNYEIGVFDNPRLAQEYVVKTHFGKPTGHPSERMVTHPIWSTWARYKVFVNEETVRKFADEIISNGFNNSHLEIDDNWETCYGSAVFDSEKFPDVKKLTDDLKKLKFKVTLWIHPFINEGCNTGTDEGYDYAKERGYFVKNEKGEVNGQWWQGKSAGAIDFTNPDAVKWWVGRLKKLQAQGIDSFKFDAGEESFTPQTPALTGSKDLQPGLYTQSYTTALAENFDDSIEARVGWRTQTLPIFIRMIDKDTKWSWSNGLPTLITTLIQMNLNGYVFVLPDMIAGNGYVEGTFEETVLPPKNMFIRWLQANVFMPSLQYSFVPWQFDKETIAICKTFTALHTSISPKIMELMKKSVQTGAPLNPPIWWVDPTNKEAHKISDEYMLGTEILVAPVIEEDSVTRDIYLPSGRWRDANTKKILNGPVWLRDYPAPLNVLPYFYKL